MLQGVVFLTMSCILTVLGFFYNPAFVLNKQRDHFSVDLSGAIRFEKFFAICIRFLKVYFNYRNNF